MDDDPRILRSLERMLSAEGHSTSTARDGFEGLAYLYEDAPAYQLVITDLRMPHLDGFNLIERGRPLGYSGAWVVYAAAVSPHDRERLRELGVNRIVAKGDSPADLLDAVKETQSEP